MKICKIRNNLYTRKLICMKVVGVYCFPYSFSKISTDFQNAATTHPFMNTKHMFCKVTIALPTVSCSLPLAKVSTFQSSINFSESTLNFHWKVMWSRRLRVFTKKSCEFHHLFLTFFNFEKLHVYVILHVDICFNEWQLCVFLKGCFILGNHGSQTVDILVSHSTRSRDEFVSLVPTFNFMSVAESKQAINRKNVQMFKGGKYLIPCAVFKI